MDRIVQGDELTASSLIAASLSLKCLPPHRDLDVDSESSGELKAQGSEPKSGASRRGMVA
jgi:hypothetical protein